jgi:hypothetical protein
METHTAWKRCMETAAADILLSRRRIYKAADSAFTFVVDMV